MSAAILPQAIESPPSGQRGTHRLVAVAIAAWLLLVAALGGAGAFVGAPGKPPFAIAIGVIAPLAAFFTALRFSRAFREYVLTLDLRLIAGMQAWRWAGMGFIDLYAHKVLPAVFALPAGIGDMAIGITAPWIMLALIRDANFAAGATFVRWNILGILDLILAVSIAGLSTLAVTGAPGEITVAPMAMLPLLIVPAFFVPLFLMLHASALMQSRQLSRRGAKGEPTRKTDAAQSLRGG
jgi:hypothetical protein